MSEHRLAILTTCLAVLTLLAGGIVNPTGSSLACPEAFVICHGTLFPEMTGGVLYEHGHRLVAMLVGFSQIALTVMLWRKRRTLRFAAVLTLVMVCFQGLLGALTVKFKLPWAVSLAHLCHAMAYLALLLWLVWKTRAPAPRGEERVPASLRRWIGVALSVVFLQILIGGLVRHHGAALASLELPLHNGVFWPQDPPFRLALHLVHRMAGVAVALVTVAAALVVLRQGARFRGMRTLASVAIILVAAQVTLGVSVILSYRDSNLAAAHFAGAVFLWLTWWALYFKAAGVKIAPRAHARVVR